MMSKERAYLWKTNLSNKYKKMVDIVGVSKV